MKPSKHFKLKGWRGNQKIIMPTARINAILAHAKRQRMDRYVITYKTIEFMQFNTKNAQRNFLWKYTNKRIVRGTKLPDGRIINA